MSVKLDTRTIEPPPPTPIPPDPGEPPPPIPEPIPGPEPEPEPDRAAMLLRLGELPRVFFENATVAGGLTMRRVSGAGSA
jgi:hypothetical protein